MTGENARRIAVVGAGITGLTVARRLNDLGFSVTVFDKGRSLGGRLSTRVSGDFAFDHGAPTLYADRAPFQHMLAHLEESGSATAWPPDVAHSVTGIPRMNALLAPLANGLDVRNGADVTSLIEGDGGWTVSLKAEAPETGFSAVAVTIPAPQALALAGPFLSQQTRDGIANVAYRPCMTMLAAFESRLPIATGAPPPSGFDLDAQIRNNAKPGRLDGADQWVVHADEAWSRANTETEKDDIAAALLERFCTANQLGNVTPTYLRGHRWRYAFVSQPLGPSHMWAADRALGLAGDWCRGPDAEHGFESAIALSEAIRETLG
ncbi:MAG: FAD-dependent oxidoreductase [Pseudomonadota bacterium]